MREKELRLALVCYGGISLAVYMHGITKEVWHLARASQAFHSGSQASGGSAAIYQNLLAEIQAHDGIRLRVTTDILAGASAGGINAVFLAHAIETGRSLEPLTRLWLDKADADILLDPDARPFSRFTKFWAVPMAWLLLRSRQTTVDRTVARETRAEVRRKLSRFIRARWFAPPFGGAGFSRLLLDAFDAMDSAPHGPPLLPAGQPLDLFVTATDFVGHAERLTLHSPASVLETEHRLSIAFTARGAQPRSWADVAELVFAARATASFPGAFPPFSVAELDRVLADRNRAWSGRAAFLRRLLPRNASAERPDNMVLIDGSVLTNAPFGDAIAALRNRPARREVDRRFVYIEPTPHGEPAAARRQSAAALPGFFATLLGAISTIPREQPIRDDLDRIAKRSARIDRMLHVIDGMRPEIDRTIEDEIGRPLFLDHPTPVRLASWRARMHRRAANGAGFTYATYLQLKLAGILEDQARLLTAIAGPSAPPLVQLKDRLTGLIGTIDTVRNARLLGGGLNDAMILFLRDHDLSFRIRRLRFLARQLARAEDEVGADIGDQRDAACVAMRDVLYAGLARYAACETPDYFEGFPTALAADALAHPRTALAAIADCRNLKAVDEWMEGAFAERLAALAVPDRRHMLRAYLGFPFYDIATLPMLQGEGLDEYDPIKVDRISPDDATAIRNGGAATTLKGTEFNNFGAFFSRAYRENDYLWGRLHGADRLIDILLSTTPCHQPRDLAALKRSMFQAILDEEEPQLPHCAALIDDLRQELSATKM